MWATSHILNASLNTIFVVFHSNFQPTSKVSTLYNLLPNRNHENSQKSKKSKSLTGSNNFEGGGNGEIKYEEQDFSNIIKTTILQ